MLFFPKKLVIYLLMALFASHLITSLGIPGSTFDIIRMKGYYYALFTGTVIALSILYSMPAVTRILNKFFPWKSSLINRLWTQLLFGIVIPFMFIFLSITAYYWSAGIWILETGWLHYCSATILIMLIFVNILNEILGEKVKFLNRNSIFKLKEPVVELPSTSNFRGRPYVDLIFISSEDKKSFAMFEDGLEHSFPLSMAAAINVLSEHTHLQANRAQIIKLTSIKSARWIDGKRRRIQVFLKGFENFEIIFSESRTSIHKHLLKQYMGRVD